MCRTLLWIAEVCGCFCVIWFLTRIIILKIIQKTIKIFLFLQNIFKNDSIVLFMTHYVCYNKGTENEITVTKEKSKCAEISEKKILK